MNKVKWHSGGILRLLFAVVLVAATCVPLPAQATAQDQQPPEKTVPAQIPPPDRPSIEQEPTKPVPPPQEPPKEKEEVKITPRQAEELFHSVDEILDFDSKQTGLPIKREVKRKLTSRDEVVSYLTKHLNDEDTQRLRRSELVLKKFGLLPRDFNLETFLVSLLREEVAGYLGADGRAGAGDGSRVNSRAAGPVIRSPEVDEARRKRSGRNQERSHAGRH
jgi:type IV secretory pathway VirB10-like protein